jgi:tyrosyl-tRNA synthetase
MSAAAAFLEHVVATLPYPVHAVLTDNAFAFTMRYAHHADRLTRFTNIIVNNLARLGKTFEEGATSLSLPTIPVSQKDLSAGIGVLNAFVLAGLAASNGEVRRAIGNGAVAVNDARITSDKHVISSTDITPDGVIKLSLGKKQHVLLKPH